MNDARGIYNNIARSSTFAAVPLTQHTATLHFVAARQPYRFQEHRLHQPRHSSPPQRFTHSPEVLIRWYPVTFIAQRYLFASQHVCGPAELRCLRASSPDNFAGSLHSRIMTDDYLPRASLDIGFNITD